MKKINAKQFNFNFFLGGRTKVTTLESGAKKFGGATKFENGIYSNIPTDEEILINEKNNTISLFVPSTVDVDNQTSNAEYVKSSIRKMLFKGYNLTDIKFYDTMGSWFSEDNNKVVVENITIITLSLNDITENDINNFIELGEYIKAEMKQEGVSIQINSSLAIV